MRNFKNAAVDVDTLTEVNGGNCPTRTVHNVNVYNHYLGVYLQNGIIENYRLMLDSYNKAYCTNY